MIVIAHWSCCDNSKIVIPTSKTRNMLLSWVGTGESPECHSLPIPSRGGIGSLIDLNSDIRKFGDFGGEYHCDHSFEVNPPAYTMLRMLRTPDVGGDTIFTSQTALYDKLSPVFQRTFDGLHAVHSSEVGDEDPEARLLQNVLTWAIGQFHQLSEQWLYSVPRSYPARTSFSKPHSAYHSSLLKYHTPLTAPGPSPPRHKTQVSLLQSNLHSAHPRTQRPRINAHPQFPARTPPRSRRPYRALEVDTQCRRLLG